MDAVSVADKPRRSSAPTAELVQLVVTQKFSDPDIEVMMPPALVSGKLKRRDKVWVPFTCGLAFAKLTPSVGYVGDVTGPPRLTKENVFAPITLPAVTLMFIPLYRFKSASKTNEPVAVPPSVNVAFDKVQSTGVAETLMERSNAAPKNQMTEKRVGFICAIPNVYLTQSTTHRASKGA